MLIAVDARAPTWAHRLAEDVRRAFEEQARLPMRPAAFADASTLNAQAPAARYGGCVAWLQSDAQLVYSDGADWLYIHDNSAV